MMSKKKLTAALLAAMISLSPLGAEAAEERPTCILMKFTDDTRYDAIESAASLSDLVMEKMVVSGKFNLKETRPIDQDMEDKLYDENVREVTVAEAALATGDFNAIFEGPGFSEDKAQSIATASVGQIITPSITKEIGDAHKADYLIQGTIINIGTGNWWNEDFMAMSSALNIVSSLAAAPVASALGGALGPLGGLLGGMNVKRTGIGVQSDLRLIKADTGEVIWCKRVVGIADQHQINAGLFSIGSSKLNANLYAKAMDKAATKIVDALIADMDSGKLFVK